ncbi:SdpI family protein [Suipraeoptans intestinalis]|uniref:SdpI family protein n=1 Tax=Suipraeoptans intestinalis TaxID=2606628 RepID=UPI002A75A333|nr:SdpI family protein [Suipraeoptans intestinalis]MDY3121698.1 SdpI family protein [Suipraeoptans intestinalis]
MGFWIFMFVATLLIPLALLWNWYICPKFKFKEINGTSGYRTARSMKNQDTWEFAQKKCSQNSLRMFFPTFLLSVGIMPFCMGKQMGEIGWIGFGITMAQMMSFGVIICLTESALKKNFDKDGRKY